MAEKKFYTREHQWVKFKDGNIYVGITSHGLKDIGKMILADLPSENEEVTEGDEIAYLEGSKGTVSLYAPYDGTIVEVNEDLLDRAELLNNHTEGTFIVALYNEDGFDKSELLTADEYDAYLQESM